MQNVSMLGQPCPTQSERSESAVADVAALRLRTEIVSAFGMRSVLRQRTGPWPKPPINAAKSRRSR